MPSSTLIRAALEVEFLCCVGSCAHFVTHYVTIPDEQAGTMIPFALWPQQRATLASLLTGAHHVILKARQNGLTTLALAGPVLWRLLFRPATTALLFSRRQEEAWDLLKRLKGMFARLPTWLQGVAGGFPTDNDHEWALGNGSSARAFPTSAGDSYTASVVVCDEFDLVEDQERLLSAVQPTVDAGGQMILLSRVNKRLPSTPFKRRYQAAVAGLPGWRAIFLPWYARPDRDAAWYAARVAESLATTDTLDGVYESYPATDAEALAALIGDKRLPAAWLAQCYVPASALSDPAAPALPALVLYARPVPGALYVIGVDPAEGNPTSDESTATVLDKRTGAEVALLAGKLEPETLARYVAQIAGYYAAARVLVERNNHGHTVLAELRRQMKADAILPGSDGKPGWLTTAPSKAALYDVAAVCFRDGDARIHNLATYLQLSSIEGGTLRAPKDLPDDRAMSFVLALQARALRVPSRRLVSW